MCYRKNVNVPKLDHDAMMLRDFCTLGVTLLSLAATLFLLWVLAAAPKEEDEHLTPRISVSVGQPFITTNLRTTNGLAVIAA